MRCPKCVTTELEPQVIEEVEIDRCPSCHGIWLDANELEALVRRHPRELRAEDRLFCAETGGPSGSRTCPRCESARLIKLNSRLNPGTILDSCTICFGTWLDAGELTLLASESVLGKLRRLIGG